MTTHRRLPVLFMLLGALVLARVLMPLHGEGPPPAISEAVVRKPLPRTQAVPKSAEPLASVTAYDAPDTPGNAFAVRPPPAPPYMPPPPRQVAAKVAPPVAMVEVPAVPAEPAPPVVPFQVIGSWNDGTAPAAFLSGPYGTLLARPGLTLLSEYKVTAVTPEQVVLTHIASQREVRLTVPRVLPSASQQPLTP